MPVEISHSALEELTATIGELETLTSKATMSSRDQARHGFLLAKVALLKQGISPTEIRRFEADRLLKEAGLPREGERARRLFPTDADREWRDFASGKEVRLTRPPERERRANEAGTQSITYTQEAAGGAFVPQGIYDRAFETMRQFDDVFSPEFSNLVETDTGNAMPFPVWDDVSNSSVQISETTQSGEVDVANFGEIQLNAYSFRSKIVAVSLELLQDSNFPWPGILERVFAMRHARGVGAALVTGSGVGGPTGLLTAVVASGAVPVIAAGSSANTNGAETGATSLGTADLGACFAKLDQMYRRTAAWYMNDATLEYLRNLLDKQGHPIVSFRKGLTDVDSDRPTILGRPVAICPSMPTMASGHNSVVLADPFYFVQRRVPSSMYIRRFTENATMIQYGLVGFESFLRVDSNLVAPNPSYLPAQFIQNHS
ncbi:MAG TPA: phage major capsid protein [Candidatus Baltobacteraceae bacterium]|nr:phage major capsid protein [Candidatus Baltobacteraceae bacterium]